MKTFKRYFRIYKTILKLNIASTFAYRANFYSSLIGSSGWSLYIIFSMYLLTSRTTSVFGWSREELLVGSAVYNIIYSIFYILFSRNFNEFADTIHYGKLDGILMRPVDSQFLMTFQYIIFGNIIRFTFGLLFLVFMLTQLHAVITPLTVIGFLAFLVISVSIIYSFWMILITLTIWFTNLINLVDLLYEINHITRFPPEMYRSISIILLVAVFPFTLVVLTPVKFLLQKMFLGDILIPLLVAIAMVTASRFFWKFALRYYTSASG